MSFQVTPASPSHWQPLDFDVLSHIFEHIALSDPVQGPITASHVSHFWRRVALESPRIWSNITMELNTDSDNTAGIPQQHLWVSAYLDRSKKLPITFNIQATRHFETWEKEELLKPHAYRIRSLHFKASEGSLANIIWMQMGKKMPMPSLEEFETEISGSSCISMNGKLATDENIIPPVSDGLVFWNHWKPTGLTKLRLDTTLLFNMPDLDEIYHALSTTCLTLHHLEYQGLIGSLDDDEANTAGRSHLEFPELRSLAVLCNDDMVPLLQLLIIPALDSLTIRDFITYPATTPNPIEEMDVDEFTFDPNALFLVIKQWTTITNLEIYGLDMSDSESPDDMSQALPEMLEYIKALDNLSSLVLYGIGVATSIARTLFTHKEPLLPNLSRFLLGISETRMSTDASDTDDHQDDLTDYLNTRHRHQLPRLRKLSINLGYFRRLNNLNPSPVGVLWESSDEIFIFAGPEVNKFIPIEEISVRLHEVQAIY